MSSSDLGKLEKRLHALARTGGSRMGMVRLHLRARWLERVITSLYKDTTIEAVESLSDSEARELRETLRRMQADVTLVADQIPFDRKLKAHLRPLTKTFQSIFLLRNAISAGIAALTLKLEGEVAVDLSGLPVSEEEVLEVRQRMLEFAPGWAEHEMGLYDQL